VVCEMITTFTSEELRGVEVAAYGREFNLGAGIPKHVFSFYYCWGRFFLLFHATFVTNAVVRLRYPQDVFQSQWDGSQEEQEEKSTQIGPIDCTDNTKYIAAISVLTASSF